MKTLDQIMSAVRTDKSSKYHNYTPVYESYFESIRDKDIVLLELGIGNIESANREGESLKGWQEYFHNGSCYAIDNNSVNVERTPNSYLCDQTDEEGLENLIEGFGRPDIVIDDASHIQSNTIKSFLILFPLLKSGGYYCIEDLQTAYFPSWGGDETIFDFSKETVMNYFFKVCHYVNLKRQETFQIPPNISVPEIYKTINSICFHHGQIIITKK
jgi:hypothetical protein